VCDGRGEIGLHDVRLPLLSIHGWGQPGCLARGGKTCIPKLKTCGRGTPRLWFVGANPGVVAFTFIRVEEGHSGKKKQKKNKIGRAWNREGKFKVGKVGEGGKEGCCAEREQLTAFKSKTSLVVSGPHRRSCNHNMVNVEFVGIPPTIFCKTTQYSAAATNMLINSLGLAMGIKCALGPNMLKLTYPSGPWERPCLQASDGKYVR